jgi:hypothetical protein
VRRCACREAPLAKLRPDGQVEELPPRVIFITRLEIARCNRRSPWRALKVFAAVPRLRQGLRPM